METKSSLTFKKIVLTNIIFFSIPIISSIFNNLIDDMTISYTLTISLVGFINTIHNWDLFALHYNRARKNIVDNIFFTVVGVILIGLLTYLNQNFIKGYLLLPNLETLNTYSFAISLIIFCFSCIFSFNTFICFKCFIDRIKLDATTAQVILFSGLLFGLLFSIFFSPLNIQILLPSILYYSILFIISSYLYNQTGSIFSSITSLSIILLFINITQIL